MESYDKLKKENAKLIELRAADEHKMQYYASLVKNQTQMENAYQQMNDSNRAEKENIREKSSRDQAKNLKDSTSISTDPATGECKQQ